MYSFVLVLLLIAITFLINIYPRRLQEPMGPTLNKISYLVLTNILIILLGSLLVIFWVNSFAYDPSLFSLLVPIFSPIKSYTNILENKNQILQENQNKAGVYMWENSINKKIYMLYITSPFINFFNNWCIYITYFFICTCRMSFIFILLYFGLFFSDPIFLCAIIPIKSYSNAEADKAQILSENQNKSAIYMWTNLINGKRYIGSAGNLTKRLTNYFSISYLEDQSKRYNSKIYRAILKYGFQNFSLEIILYCKIEDLLIKEKHYIDLLIPEYNISLDPSVPMRSRKHSEETLEKMSASQKAVDRTGENHPMFGLTGQAMGGTDQLEQESPLKKFQFLTKIPSWLLPIILWLKQQEP